MCIHFFYSIVKSYGVEMIIMITSPPAPGPTYPHSHFLIQILQKKRILTRKDFNLWYPFDYNT